MKKKFIVLYEKGLTLAKDVFYELMILGCAHLLFHLL